MPIRRTQPTTWQDEVPVGIHRGLNNALKRLQGRWSMISGTRDGRPLPDALIQRSERVTEENETLVRIDGQLLHCASFTVDTNLEPHTIDCQITAGPGKGQAQYGIYLLTDDTVRFCFSSPGGPRPTRFATARGDGATLSEWRRIPS